MKKYTLKEYYKAIMLKKEGLGSMRISKKLKIPRSTIENWINRGGKPYYFSEKRINACNSKENIERLKKMGKRSQPLAVKKAREINAKSLKNIEIDKNFSYVLGVLYGDGHLSQGRIILSAIDKEFVKTFKDNLEEWSKYRARFYKRKIKPMGKVVNRKIQWVCYMDSAEIEKFINNFDLKNLKNSENKIHFIKGFFDSEGSFSKDYELIAYNKNFKKLKLISKLLSDINLENKINKYIVENINGDKISYYHLKILGKARYLFYHKIGFNIQRKHEGMNKWVKRIANKKYSQDHAKQIA